MNRQLCSYDMFAVPELCYLLNDDVGSIYFCNLRCFAIWVVQRATKSGLTAEERSGVFVITTPAGDQRRFAGIGDVARWVTALALR